ncbi:MAG TPA: fibronectin type III domain-containing protein [Actinoplanes sp.]|nr:fibronectin type III domain-containing protein [Actinoplanes sp.]
MKSAALALAVLPVLLAGCSSSSSSDAEKNGGSAQSTGNPGRNWILFDQGSVSPVPSTTYGTASPTPSTALPTLSGGSSPRPTPSPTCTPLEHIPLINGLGVVPSSTSAVITWYNQGGSDLIDYRITAQSQILISGAQKELGWTKSAPKKCGYVSATISGLTPGTPYIFTVDMVRTRDSLQLDGVQTSTIGRSRVVSTTTG